MEFFPALFGHIEYHIDSRTPRKPRRRPIRGARR